MKVIFKLCICTSSFRHGLHHQTQQHNQCKALKNAQKLTKTDGRPTRKDLPELGHLSQFRIKGKLKKFEVKKKSRLQGLWGLSSLLYIPIQLMLCLNFEDIIYKVLFQNEADRL